MGDPIRIHLNYQDYLSMPDDGRRYEILEGDLAMTPSPVVNHQRLVARLYLLFQHWVESGAGGEVFLAPLTVILADDDVVEPDLFWISAARIPGLVKKHVHGAPDIVVEILSPSSARRDRTVKSRVYHRHGVKEYWLVDPASRSITLLTREADGYVTYASGTGDQPLSSKLDPNLEVVPGKLFDS